MTLHEPATLITDFLLGAIAAVLSWRLRTQTSPGASARRWWVRALALTAVSAFVGGSYHGFAPNFSTTVANIWWLATLLVICLLAAAMGFGLAHEVSPTPPSATWRMLIGFKTAGFVTVAILHPTFLVVVVDYSLTLVAWTVAAALLRRPWRGWMLGAIALSFIAAAVQQLHLAPAPWFNHNDLYHAIQAGALVAFYRAALRLGPQPA